MAVTIVNRRFAMRPLVTLLLASSISVVNANPFESTPNNGQMFEVLSRVDQLERRIDSLREGLESSGSEGEAEGTGEAIGSDRESAEKEGFVLIDSSGRERQIDSLERVNPIGKINNEYYIELGREHYTAKKMTYRASVAAYRERQSENSTQNASVQIGALEDGRTQGKEQIPPEQVRSQREQNAQELERSLN